MTGSMNGSWPCGTSRRRCWMALQGHRTGVIADSPDHDARDHIAPKIITSIHGKIMPVSHQQRVFSIGWCAVIIMSIPRPEVQHSLDACRILCFARNGGTIPRKQAKRQGHPQHFKSPGLLWRFWRVTTML